MKLIINGEGREFAGSLSLQELIQSLGLRREALVAEINLSVIQPERHGETLLAEGDRVELIQFVGGG